MTGAALTAPFPAPLTASASASEDALVRILQGLTAWPTAGLFKVEQGAPVLRSGVGIAASPLEDGATPWCDLLGEHDPHGPAHLLAQPIEVDGAVLGALVAWSPDGPPLASAVRGQVQDLAVSVAGLWRAEHAAQAAQQQAMRLHMASQSGHDWLWETDAAGRLQWVSESLLRHTGLDPTQDLGQPAALLYRPRDDATRAQWDLYLRARLQHAPFTDAIADRDTPRGTLTVSISGTPFFGPQGEFMGYRGSSRDISHRMERQRAADKLRLSEELYRCVATSISDGLAVLQPREGRLIALNPVGSRLLGMEHIPADDLFAHDARIELLDPVTLQPVPPDQWPWQNDAAGSATQTTYAVKGSQGQTHWIQLSCNPLAVVAQGPTFAVVATFRDITQERDTALDLARSEERWKFALEGAGHGVWDWEISQPRAYFSPGFKAMLGLDEACTVDSPVEWFRRIHPDDQHRVLKAFLAHCRQGRGIFHAKYRMLDEQGRELWLLARGKVVSRDAQGVPQRIVGTQSNITPLKLAEKALRERETAEASSQAKSEFVSRMSHEIRTPLNAVRGFAQLLQQHRMVASHPDLQAHVHQILQGSAILSDLVNDILDLQRIESEHFELALLPHDLGKVAGSVVSMLTPMALATGIHIRTDIAPGLEALTDDRRLAQVLGNLVSNAIKYNRPAGNVVLRAQALNDDTVQVQVQDTGHGMTPAQLERLFQPFERLGKDTSQIEGTGLGLMIAKSLVEAMKGQLHITSQPGRSTCVSLLLPRADPRPNALSVNTPEPVHPPSAHAPARAAEWQARPPERGDSCTAESPLRVMYVEDNRINALLFEEALRISEVFHLEVAEDGAAALELAVQHRPEVLVIDAHLPGMTGFEVLRALRALPELAQVPAYMCSADALPDDIARALQEGFDGYWTKPIDILAVTDELHRIAARGHLHP